MAALHSEDALSDEDAPEQLTFQRGREEEAQSQKRKNQAIQREKALLKEKRRRHEELFREQKKRKLLPVEVLEEVASLPQKRLEEKPTAQEKEKDAAESEGGSEKSDDDEKEEASDDEVPNYTAMRLKEQDQSSLQQQSAKDFIKNRLYGPGSNRTTVNQFFSNANKKGTTKKPAVQFVNKAWGAEKKRKATHFKSRWLHKQRVLT
ncbi:U3 small nucleolar RNA-associated protein NOL7 [Ambystoma mexicanum]|uniref:U3 small nucleolar RNA-associated protein NOL7 n=1 Tax=Ambystoma mexicanum TaxID=8296 RepID=UPI0037E7DEF1